jgi:hypothetical protein
MFHFADGTVLDDEKEAFIKAFDGILFNIQASSPVAPVKSIASSDEKATKINSASCVKILVKFLCSLERPLPDVIPDNWKRANKTGNSSDGFIRVFKNTKTSSVVSVMSTDRAITGIFINK